MQIALHFGMPFTDEDQLLWSLRKDRLALDQAGVHVPRPRFYRDKLSKATTTLRGEALSDEAQRGLLEDFGAHQDTLRIVLSNSRFLCGTKRIWHDFDFYGKAGFKAAWLRNAFAGHEVEFFFAIRNPASFLSELLKTDAPMTLEDHLCGAEPGEMFWSDVIARIRSSNPEVPITVWCHEDAPTVWPLVLAAVAGVEPDVPLAGSDALARPLLTEMGQLSLTAALGDPVALPATHAMPVLERHLELYADPALLREEIDIPGWEEIHVETMTLAYEEDLERIAAIEGVVFIRPESADEMLDEPARLSNIF